jgi:hypothetical protein
LHALAHALKFSTPRSTDIDAVEFDRTVIGSREADDASREGGLAASGFTYEAEGLAFL